MRLHYLQHVPFEDLAYLATWTQAKKFIITKTRLYAGDKLPQLNNFDWLVILGGPMNVYQENIYPWLTKEKRFIEKAVAGNKVVIGICLGAQLIASILGATVYQNKYKEIGWFPVFLTPEAEKTPLFSSLPKKFTAFHWHGDTFYLPRGCLRVAESEGCLNQAFVYQERVVGMQFHLESTRQSIRALINNCGNELTVGKYAQSAPEIMSLMQNIKAANRLLVSFLDNIYQSYKVNH